MINNYRLNLKPLFSNGAYCEWEFDRSMPGTDPISALGSGWRFIYSINITHSGLESFVSWENIN